MIRYTIKDLENYTEIKAHTIRIWEQRYKLLAPKRTDSNIRYYSDEDLRKILNVNLLYSNGYKISKIAKLSEDEIISTAKKLIVSKSSSESDEIESLIIAITALDSSEIQRQLISLAETYDIREMYTKIIVPILIRIGELWQTNSLSVAHEHHFSNLLREFFIIKISHLKPKKRDKRKVILFLPEHEEHELSLLYYHFLLKEAGLECIYLGARVPLDDLRKSVEQAQPDFIVTNLIARVQKKQIVQFFDKLQDFLPSIKLRIGGSYMTELIDILPTHTILLKSEKELLQ